MFVITGMHSSHGKGLTMIDRDALRCELVEAGLERVADKLADLALPCVWIKTIPAKDSEIAVGASKFGGCPDLPDNVDWPSWKGTTLAFLGQLNLADLSSIPTCRELPSSGLCAFFYDREQSDWGDDPQSWRVTFSRMENGGLRRRSPVALVAPHPDFTPCSLQFEEGISLPGAASDPVASLQLSADEMDNYIEYVDNESDYSLSGSDGFWHQLFGHPCQIQGEMPLQCQLASQELRYGDSSGYEDAEPAAGAVDWRLLLQLEPDDNVGWMWGDCGNLYFWIRQQDLTQHRFDRIWMILQCY